MTLSKITPDMARQSFRIPGATQWGKGVDKDKPGTHPMNASARLHKDRMRLWSDGNDVQIDPGSSIFAMGSCFAREIERALKQRGFKIGSNIPGRMDDGIAEVQITNRYNSASMLLEMQRLLVSADAVPDDALLMDLGNGNWADAHYHNRAVGELSGLLERRRKFHEHFHQTILDAEVLFFTLGLNEAGYDPASGLYRNMSPTVRELRVGLPLEVHSFSVAENVAFLEGIYALLKQYCRKDLKIFFTVSPVPLTLTYQNRDVILSNMEGKSILRAAVAEFCSGHPDVTYFYSYELAMSADPNVVFMGDKRHIRKEFVATIIEEFVRRHCKALLPVVPLEELEASENG